MHYKNNFFNENDLILHFKYLKILENILEKQHCIRFIINEKRNSLVLSKKFVKTNHFLNVIYENQLLKYIYLVFDF